MQNQTKINLNANECTFKTKCNRDKIIVKRTVVYVENRANYPCWLVLSKQYAIYDNFIKSTRACQI